MSPNRSRSRRWEFGVAIGTIGLVALAVTGLGYIRTRHVGDARAATILLVILGAAALVLFAGPGLAYSLHKRVPAARRLLRGSTVAWVRAHLYVPALAVVAAYVHATAAPLVSRLTSGKVALALAIVVVLAGIARYRLIGIIQAVDDAEREMSFALAPAPQLRALIQEQRAGTISRAELETRVASLSDPNRQAWELAAPSFQRTTSAFPTADRQARAIRQLKVWRAIHAPLTAVLFTVVGYHIAETLGARSVILPSADARFASASDCGSCHTEIHDEWSRSALAHAQTSRLMMAQLPVTLERNQELADVLGADQAASFSRAQKTCLNCHAQVGARRATADGLLPLADGGTGGLAGIAGGGDAVHSDGVGCIVCHSQSTPPEPNAGNEELFVSARGAVTYGTFYGPLFADPPPLPQPRHDARTASLWNDPLATSQLCGACHNVEVDLDGDQQIDPDRDLVLQTTYDEWVAYRAGRDRGNAPPAGVIARPLGCTECHMPAAGRAAVVQYAPGFLSRPERDRRQHTFVGVDYDLDPGAFSAKQRAKILAERGALLATAVSLEVSPPRQDEAGVMAADVTVTNNGLGHNFPTGFAFARQFWLEVSARTASGRLVPLLTPPGFPSTPPTSGAVRGATGDLPQCDVAAIAGLLGVPANQLVNSDVQFARAFPPGRCDPWLVNFQKILTDGDPRDTGVLREVTYQSFLPNIVKSRARIAGELGLVPRQTLEALSAGGLDVATGIVTPSGAASFTYLFDNTGVAADDPITVRAKFRFRHVAPDFVESLAVDIAGVRVAPAAARFLAADLLEQLVITDVVQARSGAGPIVGCSGPQNVEGASLLDCVRPR